MCCRDLEESLLTLSARSQRCDGKSEMSQGAVSCRERGQDVQGKISAMLYESESFYDVRLSNAGLSPVSEGCRRERGR